MTAYYIVQKMLVVENIDYKSIIITYVTDLQVGDSAKFSSNAYFAKFYAANVLHYTVSKIHASES